MEQKQSAVELTQQMVRIDSTNPGERNGTVPSVFWGKAETVQ